MTMTARNRIHSMLRAYVPARVVPQPRDRDRAAARARTVKGLPMTRPARKTSTKLIALATVGAAAAIAVPAATTAVQSATSPAAAAQAAARPRPIGPVVSDLRLGDATRTGPARLGARGTASFGLVGITWQPRSGAGVLAQIRIRTGGSWSDWQTLPANRLDAPDRTGSLEARGR